MDDLAARRLALEGGAVVGGRAGGAGAAPVVSAYPGAWSRLSAEVRAGDPVCGHCGIRADEERQNAQGQWVRPRLTTHHRDGDTANRSRANLLVLCDVCHGSLTGGNYSRG